MSINIFKALIDSSQMIQNIKIVSLLFERATLVITENNNLLSQMTAAFVKTDSLITFFTLYLSTEN